MAKFVINLKDVMDVSTRDYISNNVEMFKSTTPGPKGDTGLTGPQGVQGVDGKSAYDVAVVNGFVGNEAEWVLSLAGATGATGNGIDSVVKTGTVGLVDTYTVTMTSGDTATFTVTNGLDGVDGLNVDHITRTAGIGAAGTTDTYTMYADAPETQLLGTFDVYNGQDGAASTIGSLLDVDLTTVPVEDGQTIVWNEASGKWVPGAGGGTNSTQLATIEFVGAEIVDKVYSKTQLNAGQLDNRYYTEIELNSGVLDSRYFTETDLLDGSLDTRYYTESEIDTKLVVATNPLEVPS